MTLYSGPIEIDKRKKDACLYTGDYPMRLTHYIRDLKEFYNNYWDYIGTLQAPHHGAGRDNPRELYESYEHRTCVISAGSHNQFEHPNRETLINIT